MNVLLQTRLYHLPKVCPPSLQWREEIMPFIGFCHLIQIFLMVFLEMTRNGWSIFSIITSDMSENCYNSIPLPLFRLNEPNCFSFVSEHLWGHYLPGCSRSSSLECRVYSGHWPLAFQYLSRTVYPWDTGRRRVSCCTRNCLLMWVGCVAKFPCEIPGCYQPQMGLGCQCVLHRVTQTWIQILALSLIDRANDSILCFIFFICTVEIRKLIFRGLNGWFL